MKEKIEGIVKAALEELNEQLGDDEKIIYGADVKLIGSGAAMDSMTFVTFVTIIEEFIEDELDKSIEIVSDKAFARGTSPFHTIAAMEEFIDELIGETES